MYIVKAQNSKRKTKKYVALVGILIFAIIAILETFVPHFMPAFFTSISSPFWRMEFSIKSGSLESPEQLLSENEDLKRQLSDAEVRLSTIASVEDENMALKRMLGAASTTKENFILAPVLIRPPLAPYDEFIIDGGADMGLAAGDKVYASESVLIGSISEVLGSTSRVKLYSSPGESYQVLVGSSSVVATALGRGGGQYSAELPRVVVVSEGDFVIAPSLFDKPFGIVSGVISDPAQPFITVLFAPPVNVFQERWVLVQRH